MASPTFFIANVSITLQVASTTGESSLSALSNYDSLVDLIESAIETAFNGSGMDSAFYECCHTVVSIKDLSVAASSSAPSLAPSLSLGPLVPSPSPSTLPSQVPCDYFSMCSNPGFDIVEGNFGFGDVLYGDEGNEKQVIRSCLASQKNAQSFRFVFVLLFCIIYFSNDIIYFSNDTVFDAVWR